jgi:hypothetical protein
MRASGRGTTVMPPTAQAPPTDRPRVTHAGESRERYGDRWAAVPITVCHRKGRRTPRSCFDETRQRRESGAHAYALCIEQQEQAPAREAAAFRMGRPEESARPADSRLHCPEDCDRPCRVPRRARQSSVTTARPVRAALVRLPRRSSVACVPLRLSVRGAVSNHHQRPARRWVKATKRIRLRAPCRREALQAGAHTAGAFEPREVPGLVDDFQPSCGDASRGRRGGPMEGHRAARSRNASERDIDGRELPL